MDFTNWNCTDKDKTRKFFNKFNISPANNLFFRCITVNASKSIIFRWLSQLRIAPYSYDWIDNFGRKSPSFLVNLRDLNTKQTIMSIFKIIRFEKNKYIIISLKSNRLEQLVNRIIITYLVQPVNSSSCRIIVKISWSFPKSIIGNLLRKVSSFGDYFMMKKQLEKIKSLAEKTSQPTFNNYL